MPMEKAAMGLNLFWPVLINAGMALAFSIQSAVYSSTKMLLTLFESLLPQLQQKSSAFLVC